LGIGILGTDFINHLHRAGIETLLAIGMTFFGRNGTDCWAAIGRSRKGTTADDLPGQAGYWEGA
jgi:hypothetical protein